MWAVISEPFSVKRERVFVKAVLNKADSYTNTAELGICVREHINVCTLTPNTLTLGALLHDPTV